MHVVKNGYVAGAVLAISFSKKLREHVEYEKFLCRMLIDNEKTREFKNNTSALKDQIFALRYNNTASEKLTAKGRNKNGNQS
jgi:hypothetical protein